MTAIFALASLAFPITVEPTPEDIVQKNLKDVSFVLHIVKAEQKELGKINKDFGTTYRMDTGKAYFKDPNRLRLEANYGGTTVYYIINGTTQYYRLPQANITKKDDLSGSPGRIQTLLDFGALVPSLLDFFSAKYVRTDRANGDYVFDLLFKNRKPDDMTRHRIWVDPQKRYITKREWYNRKGEQLATFNYSEPQSSGGCTLPGRVEVRNVENKLGGVMEYQSVKFNTGLSDSMFLPK